MVGTTPGFGGRITRIHIGVVGKLPGETHPVDRRDIPETREAGKVHPPTPVSSPKSPLVQSRRSRKVSVAPPTETSAAQQGCAHQVAPHFSPNQAPHSLPIFPGEPVREDRSNACRAPVTYDRFSASRRQTATISFLRPPFRGG